jgi:Lrp/AsnC family transcriptional regulator, leucine-responsive regulatory protein
MLDRTDIEILEQLQRGAEISNQELADKVALSPSPCSRRVKQLQDAGYIKAQVLLLDKAKLGLDLTVLILVGLDSHSPEIMQNFENKVTAYHEVSKCYLVAGQSADYQLEVTLPGMSEYQQFLLDKLISLDNVTSVRSSFVLRSVAETTALPLKHL